MVWSWMPSSKPVGEMAGEGPVPVLDRWVGRRIEGLWAIPEVEFESEGAPDVGGEGRWRGFSTPPSSGEVGCMEALLLFEREGERGSGK